MNRQIIHQGPIKLPEFTSLYDKGCLGSISPIAPIFNRPNEELSLAGIYRSIFSTLETNGKRMDKDMYAIMAHFDGEEQIKRQRNASHIFAIVNPKIDFWYENDKKNKSNDLLVSGTVTFDGIEEALKIPDTAIVVINYSLADTCDKLMDKYIHEPKKYMSWSVDEKGMANCIIDPAFSKRN